MINYPEMTRDFHHDEICHDNYRLQVRDYDRQYTIFELNFLGQNKMIILEAMVAQEHPELFDLYDFDNKYWIESELACFWEGLQVCLA